MAYLIASVHKVLGYHTCFLFFINLIGLGVDLNRKYTYSKGVICVSPFKSAVEQMKQLNQNRGNGCAP